jgi:NADH dehydrogenase [ubiquinone] 1 alpha subcomplex assembly factor 1
MVPGTIFIFCPMMHFDSSQRELRWIAVNHGVMDGRSNDGQKVADGKREFIGELWLNTTPAMLRCAAWSVTLTLAVPRRAYRIHAATGRAHQLLLATDAGFRHGVLGRRIRHAGG